MNKNEVLSQVNKRYVQTLTEEKVINIFYKSIPIAEIYIDEFDNIDLRGMSAAKRKQWAYNNYGYLIEEMRPDVVEDDINYPLITSTRKQLLKELNWD